MVGNKIILNQFVDQGLAGIGQRATIRRSGVQTVPSGEAGRMPAGVATVLRSGETIDLIGFRG
ncbi:hypothetical protein C9E81_19000 [Paracoccus alkanivorans]|uniref:Uncharacterized protein n=2 Tax=Paracoccus alkanivorans TaxID=2116655 RepID=A0A3M0M7N4_9RHOB|nr:hypothetical protein C9E81_19000 [Paracoccus alkanivorans]